VRERTREVLVKSLSSSPSIAGKPMVLATAPARR